MANNKEKLTGVGRGYKPNNLTKINDGYRPNPQGGYQPKGNLGDNSSKKTPPKSE